MKHEHTAEEERKIREAALDETIAETFPASDPPSTLPNPDDDSLMDEASVPTAESEEIRSLDDSGVVHLERTHRAHTQ